MEYILRWRRRQRLLSVKFYFSLFLTNMVKCQLIMWRRLRDFYSIGDIQAAKELLRAELVRVLVPDTANAPGAELAKHGISDLPRLITHTRGDNCSITETSDLIDLVEHYRSTANVCCCIIWQGTHHSVWWPRRLFSCMSNIMWPPWQWRHYRSQQVKWPAEKCLWPCRGPSGSLVFSRLVTRVALFQCLIMVWIKW